MRQKEEELISKKININELTKSEVDLEISRFALLKAQAEYYGAQAEAKWEQNLFKKFKTPPVEYVG